MKSYNEMAKNALKRINEENKKLIKRKKVLKRTLIPTLTLCLAAVIGISAMGGFGIKTSPEIEESFYIQYEGAIDTSNKDTTGKFTANEGEVAVGGSAKPDHSNGGSPNVQSSAPQDSGEATEAPCIRVVDITYEGKTYIEKYSEDMTLYEKDKLLGSTNDFNGYYKDKKIRGEVFTVKDNSELLIIELDGGQKILLKEVS